MNTEHPFETAAPVFGLISECQFDRCELYGFEVEMNGTVVAPEFNPRGVPTDAPPPLMAFTYNLLAAIEDAA